MKQWGLKEGNSFNHIYKLYHFVVDLGDKGNSQMFLVEWLGVLWYLRYKGMADTVEIALVGIA